MPLDAAIGQEDSMESIVAYKKCGVVKLLSEASIQKAGNRPYIQLNKATSYVERSNAMT
jgi:hypothetical protein